MASAALAAAFAMLCVCGPPRATRAPEATELAALERALQAPAPGGFTATGRAHFESPDGSVDGGVEARVAPPDRAWLQVHSSALFDLVGARGAVSLPGDGFLLIYQERGDQLDRLPFASSAAAELSPDGRPESLLELATGRLPLTVRDGADLAERTRVGGEGKDRFYVISVTAGPAQAGEFRVWLSGDAPRRIEWWMGKELRLELRYDRWQPLGAGRIPSRVEVRAPKARLRAQLELQELVPRQEFGPPDFEVGRAWNQGVERGVSRG